ncbi:uncharacterized protein HD556DRAFT_1443792 [Suillus plorans]|uniref:Uncharacterized protein n=1 Tax=Suillus plorans TaxID=116603 RepID=A0A9P7AP29_9AGAM|nr:uncharacterized protein HD556DRAFT_1443792 [Suillus plorans]KAG1793354.1 hypothetical protein HD556DRAFT_1443792 [Suillus plorans]
MSFDPIQYLPNQKDQRRCRAVSERSSHKSTHTGHPYPRNSATSASISRTNSQVSDNITPGLLHDDLDGIHGDRKLKRKGKQPEAPKLDLTKYTARERIAIEWIFKKLEMDMLTWKGWLPFATAAERSVADVYLSEVVAQANQKCCSNIIFTESLASDLILSLESCRTKLADAFAAFASKYDLQPPNDSQMTAPARKEYMKKRQSSLLDLSKENLFTNFLHGYKINSNIVKLLMFNNENFIDGHIYKWYKDPDSPLYDETLRRGLTTTPIMLLAWSAVALRFAIDRIVNPRTQFSWAKYADWHSEVIKAMECAYVHPVHGEEFKAHLSEIHLRGMEVMTESLNNLRARTVYIPASASEMSQPLELFKLKLNCHSISQSSTMSLHSTSAEPYLDVPSKSPQMHAFAGGSSIPPFADLEDSLIGPSPFSASAGGSSTSPFADLEDSLIGPSPFSAFAGGSSMPPFTDPEDPLIDPSPFSASAGGSSIPPFADTEESLIGPSHFSRPVGSSHYLRPEMGLDFVQSPPQLEIQENYHPYLQQSLSLAPSFDHDDRPYHLHPY